MPVCCVSAVLTTTFLYKCSLREVSSEVNSRNLLYERKHMRERLG